MPSLTPFLSRQFVMCSKNTSHRARLLSPSSSVYMTCSPMLPHALTSRLASSPDTVRPCSSRPRWCSSRAFFFRPSFHPVRMRTISCLACDGLLAMYSSFVFLLNGLNVGELERRTHCLSVLKALRHDAHLGTFDRPAADATPTQFSEHTSYPDPSSNFQATTLPYGRRRSDLAANVEAGKTSRPAYHGVKRPSSRSHQLSHVTDYGIGRPAIDSNTRSAVKGRKRRCRFCSSAIRWTILLWRQGYVLWGGRPFRSRNDDLVLQDVNDELVLMAISQREAILLHPELPAGEIFLSLPNPLSNICSIVDRIGRQHAIWTMETCW